MQLELKSLVESLRTEQSLKADFIVPSSAITANADCSVTVTGTTGKSALDELLAGSGVTAKNESRLTLLSNAHNQLGESLSIPRPYYVKMQKEAGELWAQNVNHWMQAAPRNRFIRTFLPADGEGNGVLRAMLSDRYRVIDNLDVLTAALEAVKASGVELNIEYGQLTENKMYVRFLAPGVEVFSEELVSRYRVPGTGGNGGNYSICSGFVLTNSEVGNGSFCISPRAVVGACRNGMIFTDDNYRKMHLGAKLDNAVNWSEKTQQANYDLIMSQVTDAVRTFCSADYLGRKINELAEAGAQKLEHPIDACQNVCKSLSITDDKMSKILGYFMEGGDSRAFGVTQALTYFAHNDAAPEEQYALESAGVDILTGIKAYDRKYKA